MKTLVSLLAVLLLVSVLPAGAKVKRYGETLCNQDDYYCITVNRGESWQSLWPDQQQREVVMRLNRMNIALRRGMVIAVPERLDGMTIWDISPFPYSRNSTGDKIIIVQPSKFAWAAYDDEGDLVYWGPLSAGKGWCSDVGRGCRTVKGSFAMYHKRNQYCKSSKYPIGRGGAPMPYCMFFYGGYAMHASPTVPGYHASHGCVRIFKEDARWLNEEFIDLPNRRAGTKGTTVIVEPY